VIALGHQNLTYINENIIYPTYEPLVVQTIKENSVKIRRDSTLLMEIQQLKDTVDIEREAYAIIVRGQSLMQWNHMKDTVLGGYYLKYQDGVLYTMYKGVMFEANYKRSLRKFFFTDPYGTQREADKIPIVH